MQGGRLAVDVASYGEKFAVDVLGIGIEKALMVTRTSEGFRKILQISGLTLGELELLTCPGLTGFLTLLHARIASEVASLLEWDTEFTVELEQCASDTERDRASLSAVTTALYLGNHVNLVLELGSSERGQSDTLEILVREKCLGFLAVYHDLASALLKTDASDCGFTTASA